ncbi:uncharacterized protein ACLA_044070 [Aspergillus clavatus NRRL 1]|uniref:GPI anchored protein n=1 Tax=Aspergillus clavatus (strain ATCC 1007 / CBS 513.65 / DSM 816 / NCTC 3887 / NRRL 1 / QM 1276 / 107) TaxID=344612 RepID=A1C8Q0_ASPCL|nr:uncharacterized protein ACLA_044070 [Aspergillus clavatus NRRL 1]EAW13687.1 conserved hypothetical protein [Aspergillus clavatus NRRL 1]
MARISFLALASVIILNTSATSLERDTLKPFLTARFSPSGNESVSQAFENDLVPRYLSCTGGAHLCRAGQCCLYSCCSDGSCCGAGELCYNDKKPSKGPTYCCAMYTEKQCDTGCVPMQSECCGNGYYCRWGRTCRGGYGGTDSDDDDDDHETTTERTTRTYSPETESGSSSTSTSTSTSRESYTITETKSGRRSTSTDSSEITTSSSSSSDASESTSSSRTTSTTRFTGVATALAAPNPHSQAGDSAASSHSTSLNTRFIVILAGILGYLRL